MNPALAPGALAEATRRKAEKERKRAEREAKERAAGAVAQPRVDPLDAAKALLERTDEIAEKYGDFRLRRDAAFEREQTCLRTYRDLYGQHRSRLNDTRWCATDEGRSVVSTLKALRDEIDQLSGITPTDPDYRILWMARIASYHSDYVGCVLAAAQPIVSAHGNADAILVAIDGEQEEALRAQGAQKKFFFRAEGQTFYPNGYKARPEVQRVVRELQQLWGRTIRTFVAERARTAKLLETHAPDRVDNAGVAFDIVRLLSVVEASPYEGDVAVALYVKRFEFLAPGETEPRFYRGVVHLSVENGTDTETGGPAKLLTIHEVVGSIERTLPAAGGRWLIPLAKVGDGELGVRRGPNRLDDKQPWALLRCLQNELFMAGRRRQTVGQVFGLEAYKAYEQRRRGGRRKSADGQAAKPESAAQAAEQPNPAPSAEVPQSAPTEPQQDAAPVEAPEPAAEIPPQKPRKPRGSQKAKPAGKKKKASAGGNNGADGPEVPQGT